MEREGLATGWTARPPALRLFVVGSLVAFVTSVVVDPSAFGFPAIVFTLVYLALIKKLWDGERAMWWLFVVVAAGGIVAGITAAFDEPTAWAGVAAGAVALLLLLAGSTRSWVAGQSDR